VVDGKKRPPGPESVEEQYVLKDAPPVVEPALHLTDAGVEPDGEEAAV